MHNEMFRDGYVLNRKQGVNTANHFDLMLKINVDSEEFVFVFHWNIVQKQFSPLSLQLLQIPFHVQLSWHVVYG